ncbi:hypothetical protein BZA77DRAFT_387505 [Pyronema omphalodes]|nr:hypothetical protein BZA77DRAFT_387505 [Pyronema omphalodes]
MTTTSTTKLQSNPSLLPKNTIKIEGGLVTVETEGISLDNGDFIQYDYPLHVQRKDSIMDSEESMDTQEASTTGTGAQRRNTVDLGREVKDVPWKIRKKHEMKNEEESKIYPSTEIDSNYIRDVRILDLQWAEDYELDDFLLHVDKTSQNNTGNVQQTKSGDDLNQNQGKASKTEDSPLKTKFQLDKNYAHKVTLQGTYEPMRLRLEVRIPHLRLKNEKNDYNNRGNQVLDLTQYREKVFVESSLNNGGGGDNRSRVSNSSRNRRLVSEKPPSRIKVSDIMVHRTSFMVVNSEMIVIARDIYDKNGESISLPFFPVPSKVCTLQLLVHLIATTIQSHSEDVLRACQDEQMELIANIDCFTHDSGTLATTTNHSPSESDQINIDTELSKQEERITKARKLKTRLSELTTDLRTILNLLQSQLKALEELNGIFKMAYNHYPALRDEPKDILEAKTWRYENRLALPFRLQEWRSIKIVLGELNCAILERKGHVKEFKNLLDSLSTNSIADTIEQTEQAKAAQDIMKAQEAHAKHAAETATLIAKTMSMFTVVTAIFLPLNFFAAFHALLPGTVNNPETRFNTTALNSITINNDNMGDKASLFLFAYYAAPVTVCFALIAFFIVLAKKVESGDHGHWAVKPFRKVLLYFFEKFKTEPGLAR